LPDPGPEVAALVNRPGWALQSSLDPALFDGAGGGVAETLDEPAGDDLAYVAFTSGTTGGVKGIVGTHGPLTHFLDWHVRTFELTPDDRFSMLSGLSHDPLLRDVFTPACLGASLHVPDPNDILAPARLREWMNREAITVAHLTPSLARVLTEGSAAGELPHLRYVFFGGDVLTRDVVRRLRRSAPGARIVSFYGATETPQAMAWHVVPDESEDAPLPPQMPLGRGIDDVQVLVLGPGGRLAGIGETGEIVVRTPHLARGYLDDEALSREKFVVSPFSAHPQDRLYRTGDLGRFRLDGSVDFVGRRDGQVKIRGFRVEMEGVEQVLRDHPAVRHAAVLCSREGGDGEADSRLVAYVAHDAGQQATVTELRDYMRTRLPDYLVPSFFVAMDALPLTPNGKVDRRALEEVSYERTRQEGSLPPRTEMERFVAEVWSQLLGVGQVGIQDNFFDLGGHSLLAVRALSRIEARVGRRLNPRGMIYQSLEQFARGLALPEEEAPGLPAVPESGIADRVRRWLGGRGGGSDAPGT
jgi:amino acid adenylation domain-containing protein